MENIEKEVFTEEEIKKQTYSNVIKDVTQEIDERQENIKTYYPYFIITKKLNMEAENFGVDLTCVFIGLLSFLLYVGKLNSKKIEYQDIYEFVEYFIKINFDKDLNIKEVVNVILDIAQNGGNNFVFSYYSLKQKKMKEIYTKYIEIKLGENGKLNYYITPQGIDFYLKTKEFPESTQITASLLLFRKQIEKGSFNYAYDTVKRLNIEVKRKIEQKELVLEALMYGGKEGISEYTKYHSAVKEQFDEEEELFGEVSGLVRSIYTEYLSKEGTNNLNEKENKTIIIIKNIEKELNKAISSHTKLLKEAIEMTRKHDEIIDMIAKSAFSEKFKFEQEFEKIITRTNAPEKLLYFISPFLLPKKLKTFNPMNALEAQKMYSTKKEDIIKEKNEILKIDTIDDITKKRVIGNFEFYFENLLILLDTRTNVSLTEFTDFLKESYNEKALYNVDFISFIIYLNNEKEIKKDTKEKFDIFSKFNFNKIIIEPGNEDVDLGNGLKITNVTFIKEDLNGNIR